MGYGGWAPYVSVAERRRKAEKKINALKKKGQVILPVITEGRTIARTFWGKNWCDNLESYSDYENRLPRGRTYVRNGSVIDLQITAGKITAMVSGSEIYQISISVKPLDPSLWTALLKDCAGKVSSLIELLQGRLSSAVMEIVTRRDGGLFPSPRQINFSCSCPDSASMCKHVAASLYGIGARIDTQPALLFQLRGVDPQELIMQAAALPVPEAQTSANQLLESDDLSSLFGIDLGDVPMASAPTPKEKISSKTTVKNRPTVKEKTVEVKGKGKVKSATPVTAITLEKQQAAPRPKRTKTITASELADRGVPRHMLQSWLNSAVLLRTEKRGVYQVTKQTEGRIEEYKARNKFSAT